MKIKIIQVIILLFLPLLSIPPLVAEPVAPWKVGEKLHFKIRVGFIAAGRATMEVRDIVEHQVSSNSITESYKSYRLVATATSNKFIDAFYKVRDLNEAWLDTNQTVTHRFEQHNREGKWELDQTVKYDWINRLWKQIDLVKGREPKLEQGELPILVVDTLSSLYMVRTRELNVGEEFSLDVHSGKTYPLVVKVHKKETIKVDAGEFECFVVEPFLREKGLFIQKGKKMKVWLTADEKKIPVKMKAEIFIGHVHAELAENSE